MKKISLKNLGQDKLVPASLKVDDFVILSTVSQKICTNLIIEKLMTFYHKSCFILQISK